MAAVTRRQYKGAAASTTITATLTNVATTTTLTATTGWPSTAAVPFTVVIDPGTSSEEKCSATISGSTLTLTRGVDDTTAVSHAALATIYPVFSADEADEANEFASTMTTRGDLLTMASGPTVGRIAIGTSGYLLTSNGTDASWGQVATAGLATDSVTQAKIADRAVGSAELTNLTGNTQTGTSYTIVLADAQKFVTMSNASASTWTIPPNSSVAFTIGDQINVVQLGAGQVTITAGVGVTISSEGAKLKLKGQYAAATVLKTGTDTWVAIGNLSA